MWITLCKTPQLLHFPIIKVLNHSPCARIRTESADAVIISEVSRRSAMTPRQINRSVIQTDKQHPIAQSQLGNGVVSTGARSEQL